MFEQKTVPETCLLLRTDAQKGISVREAQNRLRINGPNALQETGRRSALEAFLRQLNDPLIYVLLAAALISVFLKEFSDAGIILAVVALNAFVGVLQEGKAQRALDSLRKLTRPRALVIRDGKEYEIAACELVAGDLVCLEAGRQVPADLRLVKTEHLQADESALTGESVPTGKDAQFLAPQKTIPLGDRRNMAYMSTVITGGRGTGLVTAVGMETEIGRIAAMMTENAEERTPLQKRLGELGKGLSFLSLGICAALFLLSIWQHRNAFEMLLTAISLAVAAVPEGLPAVVTLCLALSVTRMVRVNTIVRRLPAVETLGAVNVVCSDKTGTLTCNRMTVVSCFTDWKIQEAEKIDRVSARDFLWGMTLCNDAVLSEQRIGDPTELALLDLAEKHGVFKRELERKLPRVKELPFDSERKMMSTCHAAPGWRAVYTKGAPDRVLERCSRIQINGKPVPLTENGRRQIQAAISDLSARALRTLAVAWRPDGVLKEQDLIFLGLVGMEDPIRPEAADAVRIFRQAGVETVMITGDHRQTAYAVGRRLGIANDTAQCLTGEEMEHLSEEEFLDRLERVRIFARVSPADKVRIVRAFRKKGGVVAMTGDGVNDAPSLKAADVGVAMGKNGTDVARQASDIILTDDNFATIEKAIEEGRGVYENIKKTVIFLLSSNLGEILTMFAAVLFQLAAPLRSAHILWINLITDSLPALALGVDRNDGESLMRRPPREPEESLFSQGGLSCTLLYGFLIGLISLAAYFTIPYGLLRTAGGEVSLANLAALLGQKEVLVRAQTYAFTVLGMSQLFHAVGMRDVHRSIFGRRLFDNKMMAAACLTGFLLQFAVTEIPFLVRAFSTARLMPGEWMYLTGLAAFPLLAHEILVLLGGRTAGDRPERMEDGK